MLRLSLNSANTLNVKCDDILTITDPVYLWRIFNEQTKEEHLIELTNAQEQNPRFDQFTLTLPTDLDLKAGVYFWEIYESSTPGDEDYENMNRLSDGLMKVLGEFTANSSYEPTGTDTVYNG